MTTSARLMIESCGPPPKEVCLDWAAQISAYCESKDDLLTSESDAENDDSQGWDSWLVLDDGSIVPASSDSIQQATIRHQFNELLTWADQSDLSSIERRFVTQLKIKSGLGRAGLSRAVASAARGSTARGSTARGSTARGSTARGSTARAGNATSRRKSTSQTKSKPANLPLMLAIGAVLSFTAVGWILWSRMAPATSTNEIAGSMAAQNEVPNESNDPSSNESNSHFLDETSAQREAADPLEFESLSSINESNENEVESKALAIEIDGVTAEIKGIGPLEDLGMTPESLQAGDLGDSNQSPEVVEGLGDENPLAAIAQNKPDLRQTLEAMTPDPADTETVIDATQVDSAQIDSGRIAAGQIEPLLHDAIALPIFPMQQTFKFPPKLRVRSRDPVWRIRLEASEGFKVIPSDPQELRSREVFRWKIVSADGDQSQFVGIVLQVPSKKADRLQFRFAASAEELTWLQLPLDTAILDAVQNRMRLFVRQANASYEYLKALSASGLSMTRDQRGMVSSLRKHHDDQRELAEKVLTVVANINQQVGLLDGQVEVHAQILDGAKPNSPLLLQFGKFEQSPDSDLAN